MEKRSIFNKRVNILPYDYPSLLHYKDAIRHSYWIDTEYNFTTDINDFKVGINDAEREVIKKTMLAIAQIEVNVKTFWADMYKRMPITEIGDVGMTFAESEVRHKDAYARLLRILGLEDEFRNVVEIPAVVPVIAANGPLTFCEGGSVILTSSIPFGNVWSTGSNAPSIEVNQTTSNRDS
jgi:ribonucleoside-diphosphate reductase beta chain